MKVIAICGLGGSGREFFELVNRIGKWEKIIFCDKSVEPGNNVFYGCEVYTFEEIVKIFTKEEIEFVISVGDVYLREKIYNQVKEAGYTFATIVAPGVNVPKTTTLGNGVIIRDNCYISVDVRLCDNVMIQPNTIIAHDTYVGMHSVISSQSVLSGAVNIGRNTYVALGCIIKELTSVGDDTIVSMGTVVNKNVASNVIVRGNPVEVVSKNYIKSAFRLNKRT